MPSPTQRNILPGIAIGIVAGALLGGFAPGVAVHISIIGQAFLNALMMLVVPLVMLTMIVGITSLGDIRRLGALGRHTVLYYVITTSLAVTIGIIAVNVLQPGRNVSPGEAHSNTPYEIDDRTVTLTSAEWDRRSYGERHVVVIEDQNVEGTITEMTDSSATVSVWRTHDAQDLVFITAEDGTRLPFRRIDGRLVSDEPETVPQGAGVSIELAPPETAGTGAAPNIAGTLERVVVGDEETGQQGLIPRNVVAAMARMDILPVIVFSLLLGAALSVMGDAARPALRVIETLNGAVMRLVHWVMLLVPIGIFALIADRIGQAGGFAGFLPELQALGRYTVTVMVGLAVHALLVLALGLRLIAKRSPARYARGVGPALLNAVSTASSSATLPLTMQGTEEQNGISDRVSGFVLPLGATINMDGTALYESIAAIFIAQVYGITLSPGMQIVVFVTATLAAVGAAGIPEAGLVTMVIVLTAVGLPVEGIGLLLTVDWLLDRFRTTVNVWGDSVGAAVVETWQGRLAKSAVS